MEESLAMCICCVPLMLGYLDICIQTSGTDWLTAVTGETILPSLTTQRKVHWISSHITCSTALYHPLILAAAQLLFIQLLHIFFLIYGREENNKNSYSWIFLVIFDNTLHCGYCPAQQTVIVFWGDWALQIKISSNNASLVCIYTSWTSCSIN